MHQAIESHNTELFFDLSADIFVIAGYDGYFKKVNKSTTVVLGYSEEELMSRPLVNFIHEEDRALTLINREKIINGNPLLNFENRYITKAGETVWLSWTSMPLPDSKLVYAVAKEITHKKKLEEERNGLLTTFKTINKNLKKLNYTASHDMRSPVNNLISIMELLDTSKIQDEETIDFFEMIKIATNGLKETLNNYVDNIKQNEYSTQTLEVISFENSLMTIVQSIKSLITNSQATIEYDFKLLETTIFNKLSLESIFLNLITNSIKYAKTDTAPLISISTQRNNGVNQLIYKDNGQGFDLDQVKDKIFGLNQSFHNHSDSKGVGLYLVYNHVQDLGGTIEIESKLTIGTTFTISFKE
jgi:PAS domain S-box-containing protein